MAEFRQDLANRSILVWGVDLAAQKNVFDLLVAQFPSQENICQANMSLSPWVVTFDSQAEKDRQLWTKTRSLEGGSVELHPCPPDAIPELGAESMDRQTHATPPPSYAEAAEAAESACRAPKSGYGAANSKFLKVFGLPSEATEYVLELYFSNEKNKGGGVVKGVTVKRDEQSAIVEFLTSEAVEKTLRKTPHKICGEAVSVTRYVPSTNENEECDGKRTILVSGLTKNLPDHLVSLYFEHPLKSGGGEVSDFKRLDDDSALITFANEKDANGVILQESHSVGRTNLTVSPWEKLPHKTIKVSGLNPSEVSEDLLELYFSNPEKSGGGDLESIQILEDGATALVTFSNQRDLWKVIRRYDHHTLLGEKLLISLFVEAEERQKEVEASGFSKIPNREMIDLLFDKVTKSDDCIEDVKIQSSTSVLLTFKSANDAENAVRFVTENGLKWKGFPLSVTWASSTVAQPCIGIEQEIPVDSIVVSGISESDDLKNYFASSGGEVSAMTTQEDGTILITFADPTVVPDVLSRKHSLSGTLLTVTEPVQIDPYKLSIENISSITTEQALLLFVESICDYQPTKVVWGKNCDKKVKRSAMILFEEEIDTIKCQKMSINKELDGNTLRVKAVPVSRCIRVAGFSDQTTGDHLRLHFSNKKKCQGGEVTKVTFYKEEAYALVHFKEYSVAKRLIKKPQMLDGRKLFICIHYELLGPAVVEGGVAPLEKPDIIKHVISADMARHFQEIKAHWSDLQRRLKYDAFSDVALTTGEQACLTLTCTLDTTEGNREKLISWVDKANKTVRDFVFQYSQSKIICEPEYWEDIKKELPDVILSKNIPVSICMKDETHSVIVTGYEYRFKSDLDNVRALIKQIEDELYRKRNSVTEILKEHRYNLLYLKLMQFELKRMSEVKVMFNFEENTISFKGVPTDIMNWKASMYSMLRDRVSISREFSPSSCLFFLNSIEQQHNAAVYFRQEKVNAVWKCDGNRFTVLAERGTYPKECNSTCIRGMEIIANIFKDIQSLLAIPDNLKGKI